MLAHGYSKGDERLSSPQMGLSELNFTKIKITLYTDIIRNHKKFKVFDTIVKGIFMFDRT